MFLTECGIGIDYTNRQTLGRPVNLLSNGTFTSNDLTSWDNDSIGTGTASGATGAAVLVGTSSANRGRISQAFSCLLGMTYRVSVLASGSAFNLAIEVTKNAADGPVTQVSLTARAHSFQFVASSTTYRLRLENVSGGGTSTFDYIQVYRVVTPTVPVVANPQIFLDTDYDSDIDDVVDLTLLLALEDLNECDIIGICVSSANTKAAPALKGHLNYYNRVAIPVGANTTAGGTSTSLYTTTIEAEYGVLGFDNASDFEDGVIITYRQRLAAAADNSVSVIITGGLTSFKQFLQTAGGDAYSTLDGWALAQQKIRALYIVAGYWPSGAAISDMDSTKTDANYIFNYLNGVPIVLVDLAMGDTVATGGGGAITNLPSGNVMRRAWELYHGRIDSADTRPGWAQLGILAAVRDISPNLTLLGSSGRGSVNVSTGATSWDGSTNYGHNYLGKVAANATFVTTINGLINSEFFS